MHVSGRPAPWCRYLVGSPKKNRRGAHLKGKGNAVAMKSVASTWVTMGQWHKNEDGARFPYELYVTNNVTAPHVPVQKDFLKLSEFG